MANVTVTNLPTATALTGTEQFNVVQSNTSTSATIAQIGTYINTTYPSPIVSRVSTSAPITGGPITSTGTIGLQAAGVTNTYLATMNAYTIKANVTGGSAAPTDATVSAVLDTVGSTQGMTLYRSNSAWSVLPATGTNTLLSVSGPNANPAWQTLSYMIDNAINSASAQGTILYRGASTWSALPPGISGQLLQTQGAGANPQWYTVSGAGTVTSVNASGGTTGMTFTGGPITVSGTLTMSGTLATTNGGTGLTTFTSGGAVYATSTSALTTGILPVASGGTGSSSPSLVAGTNVTISGTWPNQTINASGGSGTVTNVAQTFTGGLISVSGSPVTTSGTLALTVAGTSGGIPYFSSSSAWASSAALTQYGVVYGGGAGAAPVSTAAGTAGYALIANSAAAPTFQQVSLTAGVTGTLPVANGGTGVTTSSGANSVVLRDANANITGNAFFAGTTTTAAAGTTTTLTASSSQVNVVTGSGGQTFTLPNATTLPTGAIFSFNNNQTSGTIIVKNTGATTIATFQAGSYGTVVLLDNSTSAGSWEAHFQAPSNVSWSTNTLDYAGSITSATWNGVTVAYNRGGTGLTTFTAANNAIYSTSSTALTAGTLPVAAGGSGATTLTGVLKGNGTSAFTAATSGTDYLAPPSGTAILKANSGGALANATAGTDYLAPPSGTAILKANSGGALANATAGTDYVAPGTATTFTATQTFNGTSSVLAEVLVNAAETTTVSATAATGTINFDVTTQSVLYYTSNASANWTVNFRGSSGTSLNTLMSTGQTMTVAFLVTQGTTAYYNSAVQVDGSSVTPKYQGGTAWSAGNASGIDVYTYTIIKTGSAAFTVLASQTQFK